MRLMKLSFMAALAMTMGFAAQAELQNVTVDGAIRIRANYYSGDNAPSLGGDTSFVEQRTRLGVNADFTDEVSARIEFDAYHIWGGGSFRSNYVTGVDRYSGDGVNLYQGYIQADEMWGTPLSMRIGRQELAFGSQWLVGVNDSSSLFTGLSFDAFRLTYGADEFSVDLWAAKLAEGFDDPFDSDVSYYGLYFSWLGLEDVVIDAYWMWLRDDGNPGYGVRPRGFRNADYHTIGLRGAGIIGAFDFEAELAYQFGKVTDTGFSGLFGTNLFRTKWDRNVSALGANLELGYTFDANWQPRLYGGFTYFEGGDERRNINSLWQLAWDGWHNRGNRDLAFNRLFSNWEYSEFLANTDESNMFIYRLGLSVMPSESLSLALAGAYFVADNTPRNVNFWWDVFNVFSHNHSKRLGLELGLYADYAYTEDLIFRAGWAHFFGAKGLNDGNRVTLNGLRGFQGRTKSDDYDYLFIETEIRF